MTDATLKRFLMTEATLVGIASGDRSDRVNRAIELGSDEFWGSWDWFFTNKEITFSVSDTATSYDLPDDFGGLIKIVEQANSSGGDLTYKHKDDFDGMIPLPSGEATGTPILVTTYMDDGKYKIAFHPRPNGAMDFNLFYKIRRPLSVAAIPNAFTSGVMVACAKYIPRMDSPNGMILERRYEATLRRLKVMNKVNHAPLKLGGQTVTVGGLPTWADSNADIV